MDRNTFAVIPVIRRETPFDLCTESFEFKKTIPLLHSVTLLKKQSHPLNCYNWTHDQAVKLANAKNI